MENKAIPTAEEFLKENANDISYEEKQMFAGDVTPEMLIKFAKLHVEAALKQASKKVIVETFAKNKNKRWVKKLGEFEFDSTNFEHKYIANKNSILNSYPLNQIK